MEQLKVKGLKMDEEDYKEVAFKLYDLCEDYIKNLLVRERIGRFQTTEAFAKLAQKYPGLGQ